MKKTLNIAILILVIILSGCDNKIHTVLIPDDVEIRLIKEYTISSNGSFPFDGRLRYFEYEGLEFVHIFDFVDYVKDLRELRINEVDNGIEISPNVSMSSTTVNGVWTSKLGSPLILSIEYGGDMSYTYNTDSRTYGGIYDKTLYFGKDVSMRYANGCRLDLIQKPYFFDHTYIRESGIVSISNFHFGYKIDESYSEYYPLHLISYLIFGDQYLQLEIDEDILYMNRVQTTRFGVDSEITPETPNRPDKLSNLEMLYNLHFVNFLIHDSVNVNKVAKLKISEVESEVDYYYKLEELIYDFSQGYILKEAELPIIDPNTLRRIFKFPKNDLVISNNGHFNYLRIDNFYEPHVYILNDQMDFTLPSIIDLRGNNIGNGYNALYVLALFNEKLSVSEDFYGSKYDIYYDNKNLNDYYVLVDEETAGGATIFAGFAQQNGATIIGSQTRGASGVQSIINLSNGDAIFYDNGVIKFSSMDVTFENGVLPDLLISLPSDEESILKWFNENY